MRIVIDTNVVISGTFFGGYPRKIIEAVAGNGICACATTEIVEEYEDVIHEMIERKQGNIRRDILLPFIAGLKLIEPITNVEVSRDPDDDKFIACAVDANAFCIISGDKDLLDIGVYQSVQILNAAAFCNRYFL